MYSTACGERESSRAIEREIVRAREGERESERAREERSEREKWVPVIVFNGISVVRNVSCARFVHHVIQRRARRGRHVRLLVRQFLYFCTSKASKLRT